MGPDPKPLAVPLEILAARYAQGESMNSLGRDAGVSPQILRKHMARAGFPIRPMSQRTAQWRENVGKAQRADIPENRLRELHAQGCSTREIGAELGHPEETVRKAMRRLGLARLPAKARPDHNYFWQGGYTVDRDGYILVHCPSHPHATQGGYVRQHRLVLEETLGRILEPSEVVDHCNGDTSDNRAENLRLFPSNADHLRATLTGKRKLPAVERERLRLEAVQRAIVRVQAILNASGNGDAPSQ
jgi:lambda repressor-like predicted transcriptional regulator